MNGFRYTLADTTGHVVLKASAEARQIEQQFSGWHVWVSSLGRYWAVHHRPDAWEARAST